MAATDAFAIEPQSLRVRSLRFGETPRHRFVHLTDIHHKGDAAFLQQVVKKVNDAKPDFACFTGDLVEESQHAVEALKILSGIKAPLYGIPGNHDYWAKIDFNAVRRTFSATGGAWLMDESAIIASGQIQLCGLAGKQSKLFPRAGSAQRILLCHYPDTASRFGQNAEGKFDLILAGHSHGGQVRVPGYGALIVGAGVGDYQWGMYETQAGPLYVSSGIGWFFLNARFCCPPEIVVCEI